MVLRKKIPLKTLPNYEKKREEYPGRDRGYKERLNERKREEYQKRYEEYKKRLNESDVKISAKLKEGEKKYFITYYTNAGKERTIYVNKIPKDIFKKYGAVKKVGVIPGIGKKEKLKEAEDAVKKAIKSKRRIGNLPPNEIYGHVKFELTEEGSKKGIGKHDYFTSGRKINELYNKGLIRRVIIIKK